MRGARRRVVLGLWEMLLHGLLGDTMQDAIRLRVHMSHMTANGLKTWMRYGMHNVPLRYRVGGRLMCLDEVRVCHVMGPIGGVCSRIVVRPPHLVSQFGVGGIPQFLELQ